MARGDDHGQVRGPKAGEAGGSEEVERSLREMEAALEPVLTEDLDALLEGKTAVERCARRPTPALRPARALGRARARPAGR